MSRVLLLGAGGFLGGVIARELREAGVDVRTTGSDLTALGPGDWARELDGADAVVNAAGRTFGSLAELTRANVLLLAGVLEAAQAANVRLIHLASAAEYDAAVAMLLQTETMLDDGMVYWDVRPSAHY
uniref:NAD-dependent epimerase/dehydratase family protein n=1 Tax=Deinococcus wulumuqiensis TaxID=980427 RepID=UPI00242F2642